MKLSIFELIEEIKKETDKLKKMVEGKKYSLGHEEIKECENEHNNGEDDNCLKCKIGNN